MKVQLRMVCAFLFSLSGVACSPGSGSSEEQRSNSRRNSVDLTQDQLKAAKILSEGIIGKLENQNTSEITGACPEKLSRFNSAIGFAKNHEIVPTGLHTTAQEALDRFVGDLPSPFKAFVCLNSKNVYQVQLQAKEPKIEAQKAIFPIVKSGATGYQSALSLEVSASKYTEEGSHGGRTARATYYAVDTVKLIAANGDQAELKFGISPSDLTQLKKNLAIFLQDNGNNLQEEDNGCKKDTKQNVAARFIFDKYKSDLSSEIAKSKEGIRFLTEVTRDGRQVEGSQQVHEGKLINNNIDLNFALVEPGRYRFMVKYSAPAEQMGAITKVNPAEELASLDFRIAQDKDCKLSFAEASFGSSDGFYKLEKR